MRGWGIFLFVLTIFPYFVYSFRLHTSHSGVNLLVFSVFLTVFVNVEVETYHFLFDKLNKPDDNMTFISRVLSSSLSFHELTLTSQRQFIVLLYQINSFIAAHLIETPFCIFNIDVHLQKQHQIADEHNGMKSLENHLRDSPLKSASKRFVKVRNRSRRKNNRAMSLVDGMWLGTNVLMFDSHLFSTFRIN